MAHFKEYDLIEKHESRYDTAELYQCDDGGFYVIAYKVNRLVYNERFDSLETATREMNEWLAFQAE